MGANRKIATNKRASRSLNKTGFQNWRFAADIPQKSSFWRSENGVKLSIDFEGSEGLQKTTQNHPVGHIFGADEE